MFNSTILPQHGAIHPLGPDHDKDLFAGSGNQEEIELFKQRILALCRCYAVERYLFEPIDDLLPDPKKYKEEDPAEQRQLESDQEKILATAARAYALVKAKFKPNSEAAAIIQPAEESGRLNELWKLFLDNYDNPLTKAGAYKLISSYYIKPKIMS